MNRRYSRWSTALREAVGLAYREAGGRGADEDGRLAAGVEAFLDAGGVAVVPREAVEVIIWDLSRDRLDWLLDPAEAWALRHHRRYHDGRLRWRRRFRWENTGPRVEAEVAGRAPEPREPQA
ncbi:hypothetical protein SAMN02745194_04359 [Roseomonas rosea]|uniref:Uncharacterized protein n=1 Tax=Muricoccus roseus TaxID=198092 RepID=A0A1M6QCE2_9PROT|nr:hypothetical protein [Roseomonas rosea]SHK17836.1 hypothetical protein SAMN02745194_04359 [Roseomonas rosea]